VELTIFANEYDGRTESQIASRINDIVTAGLPYLVAVARGNQPKGPQGYVSEKIVGFISLDDYCDQSSMYRYTFELELYVHPGYVSQNIAKCLLDRILEMANTGYNARGGYEYRNDFEYLKTGPSRVIKTIMLTVYKEHGEDSKQIEKYLEDFKFRRAGHVPLMGYKLDKAVDVFYFRHTTTEDINPAVPPTVPLERK
jgi:GNAT superfamily N-acetyltransferase